MNEIKWYRHLFRVDHCLMLLNNDLYWINWRGVILVEQRTDSRFSNFKLVDEKEISDLDEYKILKQYSKKLESILYQELLK